MILSGHVLKTPFSLDIENFKRVRNFLYSRELLKRHINRGIILFFYYFSNSRANKQETNPRSSTVLTLQGLGLVAGEEEGAFCFPTCK